MDSLVTQYVTVVPTPSDRWETEVRTFPILNGRSFVAQVKKETQRFFSSQESAVEWAKKLAEAKGVPFVPAGGSVFVVGPWERECVPMVIGADGEAMRMDGEKSSSSLARVSRRVKNLATEKGLPFALPLIENDSSASFTESDTESEGHSSTDDEVFGGDEYRDIGHFARALLLFMESSSSSSEGDEDSTSTSSESENTSSSSSSSSEMSGYTSSDSSDDDWW